ncbi:helix-turn-helix transcriptional regulator [Microbacterium sulfonylureivorans]|uniref:helix-turn-helix transcriptional regulator n=1 Tax=Microbacterium sulfonylureivorans TaxID=2486854 RepID=UPI000FD9B739|nr:LuxR C-terminal-related transcriptional regulator [Microbacterium sulfonylureivorans]
MSTTHPQSDLPLANPVRWTRLALAHVERMIATADQPTRGLVVGPAGSGKTSLLRRIRRSLADSGRETLLLSPRSPLVDVPATTVVLIDDAQLLDQAAVSRITDRVADPDSSIVLARRPWPETDPLHELALSLEHSQPTIVLGHVTAGDLDHENHDSLDAACSEGILAMTGGTTWLACEAFAIHDGQPCAADPDHHAIEDALGDVIAHRMLSLDPEVRAAIETLSLRPTGFTTPLAPELRDHLLAGHAEGLLLRNGEVVPVVRQAVRATTPLDRLVDAGVIDEASGSRSWTPDFSRAPDPRRAEALLREGDAIADSAPSRARELFRRAGECGADAATVAVRRAGASWALGEIDHAARLLDSGPAPEGDEDREHAIDTAAAIWAARGAMETANAIYAAATPPLTAAQQARAAIAALGAADPLRCLPDPAPAPARPGAIGIPTTLDVSLELVVRGLRSTLTDPANPRLADLVRASEMYTASATGAPIPELPAVIAALTAINLGELDVSHAILQDAVEGGHGGPWARDRLVLWRSWVALQRERPHEVMSGLDAVRTSGRPLSPRDRLVYDAIDVALARRYEDKATMVATWRRAREGILHAQFDMFTLLPLAEFVTAAARAGDSTRVAAHFDRAVTLLDGLGAPPLWSAHLHWAGIQRGILANSPDALRPHARALVAVAPQSRLASRMAQAGRVWTSVLAGTVDPDAVEEAALGLADVGLAWDGARLAGHGAGRSDDRRDITRLLACARRLHPRDDTADARDDLSTASTPQGHGGDAVLSAREREVALLVLQGKTYSEIGMSIFISPRTAEHHIARIRRRLGATSRSDLIAKLRLVFEDASAPQEPIHAGRDIA